VQRSGGEGSGHNGELSLSQPLFDAARWRSRAAQQQRLAARDAEQALAEQQLRQDSARLYVQWHGQAGLATAQAQLARAYADEATRMGVRHREGLAAAVDWRQSQSFQWLAEASARGATQQLRALRQALVAHAGDAALLESALLPLREQALPLLPDAGGAGSPRLEALRQERAARDEERAAARAAAWPQLRLQAQAQAQRDAGFRDNRQGWQLHLSLPLWDSGALAAGRAAAGARLSAAEAALQQAEREQQREQATQRERLQAAREQHATAQGALDAAALTVAAMRVGQEQGSRSTSDVLLALQTEAQLRQLALLAQTDAWLAWIALLAAQGRFDDAALRMLNTQLEQP
jgi:outer membrane protein